MLHYLKNIVAGEAEPNDFDVFFRLVARYSEDLFGFDFRRLIDEAPGHVSNECKSAFLENLIQGKVIACDMVPNNELQNTLAKILDAYRAELFVDITQPTFDKNFSVLCDAFYLPDFCRPLLQAFVYIARVQPLRRMIGEFVIMRGDIMNEESEDFLSVLTGVPLGNIQRAMAQNSPLFESGIMVQKFGDNDLSSMFKKLLGMHFDSPRDVRNVIIGEPLTTELGANNFDYISDDFNRVKEILRCATESETRGVNILLYGNPGCGKTEFAKTVCAEIGKDLYATSPDKSDKENRLSSLAQVQTVLKQDANSIVLFDEAEDVFSLNPFNVNSPSKLYINNKLEHNNKPVIWITNNIKTMDRAYIRRFTFALKMSDPSDNAKQNAWQRIFDKHNQKISPDALKKLIKKYSVPMALVDTAVKNAKILNDDSIIESTLDNLTQAMTGATPPAKIDNGVEFDTALLNTDVDLKLLAEKIKNKAIHRFSMCLYGASGTGKTAFASYLADVLGMPIIKKRASDLKGPYVGETEHNIAAAFAEASAKKAILVFDEADSFLQDRESASHSWEVSCVNEMLTQMESAQYPFICTTNLMKDLDKASLRRFSFKVKYNYLTPAQVVLAFRDFFGQDVTEKDVAGLNLLAPGDFSVVKSKAEVMDITDTVELISMLRAEQSVKDVAHNKIGF